VGIDNNGTAQFVYIAAVGHLLPTAVNIGAAPPTGGDPRTAGSNGGLIVLDSVTPAGNFVINEIDVNGTKKKLVGINSVSVRPFAINSGVIDYAIMITDSTGVYEVARNGNVWSVVWMMPNNVYRAVRRVQLRASGAKRLTNGHVLITNSFVGKTDPGPGGDRDFYGEVTQWLGDTYNPLLQNMGFATDQLRLELPPIVGSRGLRNPQFADRH
jgi:hypothetical protein